MKKKPLLLIMLPGFPGTPDLLYPFEKKLSGKIKTKVIGFPNKKMTFDEMNHHVGQKIPVDEPVVILGESYSGPVALSLANQNSFDIRGLILCATFIVKPHSFVIDKTKFMPLRWMFSRPMPELVGRLLIGEWDMPIEFLRKLWASSMKINGMVMAHRVRQLLKPENFPEPKQPKCPVLVLEATNDRLLSKKNVEKIRRIIPKAKYEKIEGPHWLLQLRPEESSDSVLGFISSL